MAELSLLEQFGQIRRLLNQLATQAFREVDLGPLQATILRAIWKSETPSMTSLVKSLGGDPAAIGRTVDLLMKRGYVLKQRHPIDRRQWLLGLTPKGRGLAPKVDRIACEMVTVFAASLTAAERQQLERIQENLTTHLEALVSGKARPVRS